jgi:hypothetical protein
MSSHNPEHDLTPAEIENLSRLEAIAQDGLATYKQVENALAEIRDRHLHRDSHASFEAYVRERWGLNAGSGDPMEQATIGADADATPPAAREPGTESPNGPCEALAKACEELSALDGEDRLGIEIRFAVRKQSEPGAPAEGQSFEVSEVAEPSGYERLPALRWLLAQASGTVAEVSHELESRAPDIDDSAREQLRNDVLVLDGELAVVKALLIELHDWDSELMRLLADELPPFDTDADTEDDD